jgi:hypothetical protein
MAVATVDAGDYERVIRHPWWTSDVLGVVYPITEIGGKDVRLGQFVLGLSGQQRVTYFDRNPLNCRRSNVAACSRSQMMANARPHSLPGKTSRFRGVSRVKGTNNWVAYVSIKGKICWRQLFRDEVQAALARDEKARELYGRFARLNFPDPN